MSAAPALLAAAGVGLGHAVLPDHWVPLAVLGRTRRFPLSKVARLSGLAGAAHVLVSVVLGAVLILIGLQFRARVEHAQDAIVGSLLLGTAFVFAVFELSGRGHGHSHPHSRTGTRGEIGEREHPRHQGQGLGEHEHPKPTSRVGSVAAIVVPLGAAASPDLTILPVFLAATTAGAGAAIASLFVFAGVTIATIVGLTLFATVGGYQVRASWLDRWGNVFTAAVLGVIGAFVLAGVI